MFLSFRFFIQIYSRFKSNETTILRCFYLFQQDTVTVDLFDGARIPLVVVWAQSAHYVLSQVGLAYPAA